MRILLLIAIGLLLYIILNNLLRRHRPTQPMSGKAEKMVQCRHCGLHILEQEAIRDGEYFYCSQEHQHADK